MPMSNCHASQSIDRRHCRRLIMRRSSSRLVCQTRESFKFNLVLHNFRLTAQCDENLSALFWYAGRGGSTVELDTLNACLYAAAEPVCDANFRKFFALPERFSCATLWMNLQPAILISLRRVLLLAQFNCTSMEGNYYLRRERIPQLSLK